MASVYEFVPAVNPLSPELELSLAFDVINCFFAQLGMPLSCRAFVDAVIGTAHKKLKDDMFESFEASDLEIGRRMRGEQPDESSRASLCKHVQRARKTFTVWQQESNTELILCEPGGQDPTGKTFPSRYTVPILPLAIDAMMEFKRRSARYKSKTALVEDIVESMINKIEPSSNRRDRFRRPRQDAMTVFDKRLRTIGTFVIKEIDAITLGSNRFKPGEVQKAIETVRARVMAEIDARIAETFSIPKDEKCP